MRLYLVQHGEARTEQLDPARPLTSAGRSDVEKIARLLKKAGVSVEKVLHSGKTRARQTAEILAAAVGAGESLEEINGIAPDDPVPPFIEKVAHWSGSVMVVGHLPFMARLVSRIVTGDENAGIVSYTPGSVVCVERGEGGEWAVAWMLRPELSSAGG